MDPDGKEVDRFRGKTGADLVTQINEIADKYNRAPKWAEDQAKALEAGKSGDKPVALFFHDDSQKSQLAERFLGEQALTPVYEKFEWAKVPMDIKGDEAKKLGLTALPALWVVDAKAEDPLGKPLKKFALPKSGTSLKGEMEALLKASKSGDKEDKK